MNRTLEQPSLCVFCGGSDEGPPAHRESARQLGKLLADAGVRLVYGGGSGGVMGSVSAGCLEAGGFVHGIIPEFLMLKEQPEKNLSRLEVVDNLHIRTQRMAQESHAFCALPGGLGTAEEILEFFYLAVFGAAGSFFYHRQCRWLLDSAFAVFRRGAQNRLHTASTAGGHHRSAIGCRSLARPGARKGFRPTQRHRSENFVANTL